MKTQNQYTKAITLVGLTLLLLTSAGCKKSSNDNSQQVTDRSRGVTTNVTQATTQTLQNGQTVSESSFVTTSSGYDQAFQDAVKSLASAQIDPQYIGSVSPTQGVVIRGYIEVDQGGNMSTANSRIALEIHDEYAGQGAGALAPITILLQGAQGYAYNGQFQLTFRDQLGEIMVRGQYQSGSGGITQGAVYFANFVKWDGSTVSNPQYAGLGSFAIKTCGFFRCQ